MVSRWLAYSFSVSILISTACISTTKSDATPISKRWNDCKIDSDCVLHHDHCGSPTGIRKDLLDEYNKFRENMSQAILCQGLVAADWPKDPNMITVKCIRSRCIPKRLDKPAVSINKKNTTSKHIK